MKINIKDVQSSQDLYLTSFTGTLDLNPSTIYNKDTSVLEIKPETEKRPKEHVCYSSLSDAELVTYLKAGNHSSYTEIYNRYFCLLFTFAYKKLRDEELTKDFVQELFITLWNKKDTLLENGKLASFLYISIRSRIFDYFLHQRVQHKYLDFLREYELTSYEKTDHLIREKELANYIEKEIQALPRKMRQVFELSRKKHLSNKEIAEQLHTSESNVSKHITNAVKIFREKVGYFT